MIKSLTLKNIQKHKDSTLEFSPGVNVIYGRGDQGKTTIIRSLYELITNSIPVDVLFRWGLSKNKHTAEIKCVTDEHTVSRVFGKDGNKFVLDEEVFNAPKQGLPPQISKALNMTEVNIQKQLDSHFLLTNISSGKVAKRLNATIGLDDIDNTQDKINSLVRELENEKKSLVQKHEEFKESIKNLEWVDGYEKKIKRLNKFVSRREKLNDTWETLDEARVLLDELYNEKALHNKKIKSEKAIKKLSAHIDKMYKADKELQELVSHKKRLDQLRDKKQINESFLNIENKVDSVISLSTELKNENKSLLFLQENSRTLARAQKEKERAKKALSNAKDELSEYKKKVEICPLCGSSFNGGECVESTS